MTFNLPQSTYRYINQSIRRTKTLSNFKATNGGRSSSSSALLGRFSQQPIAHLSTTTNENTSTNAKIIESNNDKNSKYNNSKKKQLFPISHTNQSSLSLPTTSLPTTSSFNQLNSFDQSKSNQLQSIRQISSVTEILPEFVKQYSVWGGSGIILKTFHGQNVPYWGCMSLTNILVRTSLVPLVIKGAKTSARFGNVAPEVQFLMSSYIRDAKKLKDANARPSQRLELLIATWKTLLGIWKLNGVNPLDVMKSPLMQIPVFWYFSIDIRKLINGGDPELAQELTESGFFWVMDLTEPDPWYGLPILSGLFLYLNVEVAVGKQNLSGETASKSNLAQYMKDGFQSLAVVMPCFMSQSPAGVQIYLLTSFIFTLFQGAALRNDNFRGLVGLPLKGAPPPEGKFVKEFIQLNKLERDTYGILAPSAHASFRPFAQMFSKEDLEHMERESSNKNTTMSSSNSFGCILAPEFQPLFEPSSTYLIVQQLTNMNEDKKKKKKGGEKKSSSFDEIPGYAPSAEEAMLFANRGEKPPPPIKFAPVEDEIKGESDKLLKTKFLKSKRKKKGQRSKHSRKKK